MLQLILLIFFFRNETPKFYMERGEPNKARDVLRKIYDDDEVEV